MSRPAVSVVMPFAGHRAAARAAIEALLELETAEGDELILADNAGTAPAEDAVTIVRATGEQSPAHARNTGAARARNDWILFLDADCRAQPDLLDAYFIEDVGDQVGVLAGEVVPDSGGETLAARYSASKSFLSQEAHLAHPYRPRAVAANLLVRRAAFEQIGGFYEGVRAAEDTDFAWRAQEAGWRLELRRAAWVEHRYRPTVRELRRQWRGYAAGRAWLARRYAGFEPEPALRRALGRAGRRVTRRGAIAIARGDGTLPSAPIDQVSRLERGRYAALDALLAAEELAGLTLSNRPAGPRAGSGGAAKVVLIADRFPALGDPLVDFARLLDGARVEAAARPELLDTSIVNELDVEYREDDGAAARMGAFLRLLVRHPIRSALDFARRQPGDPALSTLAPMVRRIERTASARVQPLGGDSAHRTALRVAALAGRALDEPDRAPRRRPQLLRRS
jgi:GT2 family glycosyltransferase